MSLKLEYEELNEELKNVNCIISGCSRCPYEKECSRLKFLETYLNKNIFNK